MGARILTCVAAVGLALLCVSSGVFGVHTQPPRPEIDWPGTYELESAFAGIGEQVFLRTWVIELFADGRVRARPRRVRIEGQTRWTPLDPQGETFIDIENGTMSVRSELCLGEWTRDGDDAGLLLQLPLRDEPVVARLRWDTARDQPFAVSDEIDALLGLPVPAGTIIWLEPTDGRTRRPRPPGAPEAGGESTRPRLLAGRTR